MAGAHTETFRKVGRAVVRQDTFGDQAQCPPDGGRGSVPGGCSRGRVRPAPQTGTKARRHRLLSRTEEADVGAAGRAGRADRPAVDARRQDPDEELSVVPSVPGDARPVANLRVELHAGRVSPTPTARWPLPDI